MIMMLNAWFPHEIGCYEGTTPCRSIGFSSQLVEELGENEDRGD